MAQNENENRIITYKVCLIGDGGVGKTTYINRVIDGRFEKRYNATVGATNNPVSFRDNYNNTILFDVWDTAGQEKYALLKDVYYIDAHAAIFFFDVTSRVTCQNLGRWVREFQAVAGENVPIIVCANKMDLISHRKAGKKQVEEFLKGKMYRYYEISAKSELNIIRPFVDLARQLTRNANLIFASNVVEPSDINRSDVDFDQRVIEDAMNMLPDEYSRQP
ncbi:GTP-binding nuclear protein [Ordospora colligata]|uniref:GTP-binding nuclear protein n=1 Tax=Ordospora colligata OC4 TaxID=1354746 RepID=A0A0B2ULR6_9MICR|nr:GTP-binding nuclear protein [Ordospora colligata OC4]KHN70007.1 GTP-binding nuclear protein [Ordospora colligata OC4]TBU16177.1 GTP-binding nuclear protein [Ordospora colligata]TBU16390.1 GTP-binding nuclear protein [Ordospora colligata]TBU19094.1 GTP-binding nuclear protein [Ordospora colligata]